MRDDRSASPAYSPRLLFTSRCIEFIKTVPVTVLKALRRKPLQRKLVSFGVALNLLIWPGPGLLARDFVEGVSRALEVPFAYTSYEAYAIRSFYSSLLSLFSSSPQQREDTETRSLRVRSVTISPAKLVGYLNQHVSLSAIGKDALGNIAQGARFDWASSDPAKLRIDDSGQATLLSAGLVWVSASTASASSRTPVLIRPIERPPQSDLEWQLDQDQLRPDGVVGATTGGVGELVSSLMDKLAQTVHAQTGGGDSGDFLYDELWSEPRNLVGSPRNRVMDASRIGPVLPEGSNFEFSIPIADLPGRGLHLGLSMNYNSRIWSRHGSAVTFNAVNSWPYLGFTLSFGRIVTYAAGSNTKFVLIDEDGTRHYLGSGPGGTTTTYQTNDGSHITYVGTATGGGTLYYNSGVTKSVWVVNNRLLVTQIKEPNGNFISISYASQTTPSSCNSGAGFTWKQAISSITDTLGRVISFNYDDCNNLVSITGPGLGGTSTTLVQFDYNAVWSVSNSFSGLTVENRPTSYPVVELKHAYFPDTQTGYLFSYSAYGMIYNVSMRKQMSIDQYGVISDGTEKSYVNFNYPTSASSLTDSPAFTQRTEYPAATSGGTAVHSYATGGTTGTNKTFTISRPDSSTVTLTRSDASGVDFGLLTKTEIKNSGGTPMAKAEIAYANDPGGQPQVQNVISYDDATPTANQVKVDFDYDSYGNVTNTRQYGFQESGQWKVRRRTRSVYKTDSSYVNAYLRSLVIESDVYDAQLDTSDANDILIAKSTYTFDDYNAMNGMENYGGTANPPGHDSSYDTTRTVRGNVTGKTVFTDVNLPASTTWLMKLDIFGNVTKRQLTCCNEQTTTFTDTNGYALAETLTKGASGGPQVTTSATYDFNTSTTSTGTDPNSLVTTVNTRDAALRPTLITYPTGATASATYNDSTPSESRSVSYDDSGTQKTVTSSTVYDNLGRVIQEVNAAGAQVNTAYDVMGRVASRTNPFPAGGTPGALTSYSYDALGRATVVTLPDNQTVQTSYNGTSVTVTDQVTRKIQRISDGLGRLITVNEQDISNGQLTQATSYSYNYLDRLTEVNQGGQFRKYKYDAIGRLLFEKIPEQTPTIADGGVPNQWTTGYTYTIFDEVYQQTDARGVISTFTYDGLNRVTQVSYNTVSGVSTAPTVSYVYDYDSTYGTAADGMVVRVNVGTDYQERYTFDSSFQVASTIHTIGSRTYTTSCTRNQASQPTQWTYPSSRAINVSHDSIGRVTGILEGGNGPTWLSSVTYNNIGQMTADALGNGVTEHYGYDANRMQLTSQKAGTASPYTNRMDLTYSYSATSGQMGSGSTAGNAGQLMSISGTINGTTESATYTYDNLGRLVTSNQTSNGSTAQRRFAYDRWGNRTGVWDATSGGNQIQSIVLQGSGGIPTNQIASVTAGSTLNYTYDAAGNVTNDGVHSYTYDSENRLVSVDGGSTASYAYDYQNRRYKKTVGSAVTHYVWQGSQVLAEHNGSTGAVLIDYVYSGIRMIAKVASGTTSYFLNDRLSARLTLNTSGGVVGRQAHLAFGEDFGESGTQEKHHFTSYERDGESGTDYAVNRQYSERVGRFMRVDPVKGSIRTPQSLNGYAYVRNNPVDLIDPRGLEVTCFWDGSWICFGDATEDLPRGGSNDDMIIVDDTPDETPGGPGGGKSAEDCRKDLANVRTLYSRARGLVTSLTDYLLQASPAVGQSVVDDFTSTLNDAWSAFSGGKVKKETKTKVSNSVIAWTNSLISFLKLAGIWTPDAIKITIPHARLALKSFVIQARQLGKDCKKVDGLTPEEQRSINNLSSDANEFVYSRIYDQLLSAAEGG